MNGMKEAMQRLQLVINTKTDSYGKEDDPLYCLHASARVGINPWRAALGRMEEKMARVELEATRFEGPSRIDMEAELIEMAHLCLIAAIELDGGSVT
jgi:hypothetical protein